jgi:hypothetical protein
MSDITKEPIEIPGATVPFFTYQIGETQYYEFDTSKCGPPEPMVNAMAGLKMVDGPDKKVVMINHKKPMGLLDKIGENFALLEEENLPDGTVKLVFGYKPGASEQAKLDDASCAG